MGKEYFIADTVYVLGDFSSYNYIKKDRELINCLNSGKVLVMSQFQWM